RSPSHLPPRTKMRRSARVPVRPAGRGVKGFQESGPHLLFEVQESGPRFKNRGHTVFWPGHNLPGQNRGHTFFSRIEESRIEKNEKNWGHTFDFACVSR